MKIVEFRFLGTEQTHRAVVDARTIKDAEHIVIDALAADPNARSASFKIVGNAKKADRGSLPTIHQVLAA